MKIKALISSIIICFIPAIIHSFAVSSSSYTSWPGWIFGPFWSLLYLIQGISLYFIRITSSEPVTKLIALLFFYFQLVLNLLWSVFFFTLSSPKLALAEIGLLIITLIFCIISTYRVNKPAGTLLLPYLGFTIFAAYFNYSLIRINNS